ncbi:hypothetical protein SteCoe_5002 [Stentor coeruleus]|uniref:USP domain-containing protein n=1 Tax=Stentor coeruleus TaxID=5963 RepID=A0A1R2CT96_9CILI|nr:hypothetical protein SteCoe_5002 [Stentor coeruleus]
MDAFYYKLVEVSDKGWNVALADKNDCGDTITVYLESFEYPKTFKKTQVKNFRTNTECLKGSEKIMSFANFMNFEKIIEIIENLANSITANSLDIPQNLRGFIYFAFNQMIALDYFKYKNYLLSFRKVMVELLRLFEKLYSDNSLNGILQECEPEVLEMMRMILNFHPTSTFFFGQFGNDIEGYNMQNTPLAFVEYMRIRYLLLVNNNIDNWLKGGKSLRFTLSLGIITNINSQIIESQKKECCQRLYYFLDKHILNLNEEQSKFYNAIEISNLFLCLNDSLDGNFDINAEIIGYHIRAIYFVKSIKSKIEIMQIINNSLSKSNTYNCLQKMMSMNFHLIALQHQDLIKYLTEYFRNLVKVNYNLHELIIQMITNCHDPETLSKIIELIIFIHEKFDYYSLVSFEVEFLKKWSPKFFQHFVELCQTIIIMQNDYSFVIEKIYSCEFLKPIEKSILCVEIMNKHEMTDLRHDFIIKLLGDYTPNFVEDVLHKLLLISDIQKLSKFPNFIDNLIDKISLAKNSLLIHCLYTKIDIFGPLISPHILLLYERIYDKPDCLKVFINIIKRISHINLAEELIVKIFKCFNNVMSEDNTILFLNLFLLINKDSIYYNGNISSVFRKEKNLKHEDLLFKMFFDKNISEKYKKDFINLIILLNTKFITSLQWTKDIVKGFLKRLMEWKNNKKVYQVIENLHGKDYINLISGLSVEEAEEYILASEQLGCHGIMIKIFYNTLENRKPSDKIGIFIEEIDLLKKLNVSVESEATLLYYLCNLETYEIVDLKKFPLDLIFQQTSRFITPLTAQIFVRLYCKHYQKELSCINKLLTNESEFFYKIIEESIKSCKISDSEEKQDLCHEDFILYLCKFLCKKPTISKLIENIFYNLLTNGSLSFLNLVEILSKVMHEDNYDLMPIIKNLNSEGFKSICLSIEVKANLKTILKLENLFISSSIVDSLPLIESNNPDYSWFIYKLCKYKYLQISVVQLIQNLFDLKLNPDKSISPPIIQDPSLRKLALKIASLNKNLCIEIVEHKYKSFLQDYSTKLIKSQSYIERYDLNELKGLKNFGSTCYINSTFQLLYSEPALRKCIQASQTEEQPSKALSYIFNKLTYSCMKNIKTRYFLKEFKNYDGEEVNSCLQMDAEEFFTNLMYQIENQDTGKIIKKISTSHKQTTKCSECNQSSSNFTNNFITPIEIEGITDIHEAIEGFKKKEILYGDNQFYCHHCLKKVDAEKSTELDKLPEFLLLSLKRFKYDVASQQMKKIMSKCALLDKMTLSTNTYELSGFILHIGNDFGGHYVTVSKRNDIWYLFNDEIITKLNDFNPEDLSSSDNPTLSNPSATPYIILYKVTNFTQTINWKKYNSECSENIKNKNTQVINFNLFYNTDFRCFLTKLIEKNISLALDVYISGYVYFVPPNEVFMNKIYIRFLDSLMNSPTIKGETINFILKKDENIVKILTGKFNNAHKFMIVNIIEKSFSPEVYYKVNNFISSLFSLFCYNHTQYNMTYIIKLIVRFLEKNQTSNSTYKQLMMQYFYSQKIDGITKYSINSGDFSGTNFKEFFKYILNNYEQIHEISNMLNLEYFDGYCFNFPTLKNMKKFGRIMGKFYTKDLESMNFYIRSLSKINVNHWESLFIDMLKSIENPNIFYSDNVIEYIITSIEHLKSPSFIEKIINIIKFKDAVEISLRDRLIRRIENAISNLVSNKNASNPPNLFLLYKNCYEGIDILKKNVRENNKKESCEEGRTFKGGFVILRYEKLALLNYTEETKLIFLD